MAGGKTRSQLLDDMSHPTQEGASTTPASVTDAELIANGDLTLGNANAFAFAWENPYAYAVWAEPLIDVTTAGGTAGAVLDVGAAAGATTHASDSISGLPIDQIISYRGSPVKVGVGEYVTGQILVANAASLVGKYYVRFWPV